MTMWKSTNECFVDSTCLSLADVRGRRCGTASAEGRCLGRCRNGLGATSPQNPKNEDCTRLCMGNPQKDTAWCSNAHINKTDVGGWKKRMLQTGKCLHYVSWWSRIRLTWAAEERGGRSPPKSQQTPQQLCSFVSPWFSYSGGTSYRANMNISHRGLGSASRKKGWHQLSGKQFGHRGQQPSNHTFRQKSYFRGCSLRN